MNKYEYWLEKTTINSEIQDELIAIKGSDAEIEDRFYRDLEFGTGGLRGIIGAGTNRMNVYTVGRATHGLAKFIIKNAVKKSVVIAYDSRNKSREFAFRAAQIFSANGIMAYIFDSITPTPVLSFAVRYLKAGAGIVITASHNPKEYNGYKVYNENGCQITDAAASQILAEITNSEYFTDFTENSDLIKVLNDEILNTYLSEIQKLSLFDECDKYAPKIVYTPLHGTGNIPVRKILEKIGAREVYVVKEQELPDGNFTTCPYPNPEEKAALELAIAEAKRVDADLVLATDPDADRVGIAVRNGSDYVLLNGNETGLLLTDYMLCRKTDKDTIGSNPTIIKTIVTTDMAFDIAKAYGATVKEVLTGFKYIGEELDKTENFVIGMEESYGYLVGAHARDKDAVSAAMMIVEMYAYYNKQGRTLYSVLRELYEKYGYYLTDLVSKTYKGSSGAEKMKGIINTVRSNPNVIIDGEALEFTDFGKGIDGLPKSDVLRFKNDTVRVLIRPSGTEPKIKIYYQIKASTLEVAKSKLSAVKQQIESILS